MSGDETFQFPGIPADRAPPARSGPPPSTPREREILVHLNPAQREAVLHESGPLMVLAGAGSGKTRVITHRIAHLLLRGYPPDSILAITFTNKAAAEMKSRTEALCGIHSPWISTFHSFCARILRRHIHRLEPYDHAFTIYDSDDSQAVIKEVLKDLGVEKGLWSPRAVRQEISRVKNTGMSSDPQDLLSSEFRGKLFSEIHETYVARMKERNALDFDDLLLLTVRLLEEAPDVLDRYRGQFQHVLIDEYQDINAIQYQLGRLLTESHRNLCVTGDPDQSIYAWRGADVTNLLNFERDFPEAKRVTLDRNYRSTANILDVANALIVHNTERWPKDLWTDGPRGQPVRVYRFEDDRAEAKEIAEVIEELTREGQSPGDIAVFYRINALSRPIEQQLIYANIPYSIVAGLEFFLRKEVKDILGYIRVIENPRDVESLRRVINVPARGIGKSTVQKLLDAASRTHQSAISLILDDLESARLSARTRAAVASFGELYRRLRGAAQGSVADAIEAVIRETGYEEFLKRTEPDSGREQIANVWELHSAGKEFDREHPQGSLTEFLELVNLLGDVDRWERSEDRVALMTLHSAKGLEFPVVVIAGVEDGILPLLHADDPDPNIQEERRILYVGITRAKRQLFLTHVGSRMRFGKVRQAFPSRFLLDLRAVAPPEAGPEGGEVAVPAVAGALELDPETVDALSSGTRDPGSAEDAISFEDRSSDDDDLWWDSDEPPYAVGTRVEHDDYGEGIVLRIGGVGQRQRITVAFDECGEKQFVLGYAPLRRIR